MSITNFETFLIATFALDALDRADVEREFTARYQGAVDTFGTDYAEALARAETLHLLLKGDLDFEGDAYVRSHLS